ncbi:DNA cytosine methyltransferase [Lutibaculum baratangense]|uniref:Cytosine-specific methyltransferase n=1 Tax=Lutibaculum baratangense AMV1 TaxID=631454 RepID=V4RBE8_9HYPH|nr:DNA (cytosine-5-)-methyltransferase [Lutibaculum baratangense]ESR22729.1 DNA-cytosine methyltransferase [Lutibaculum baratangense AMV1]
MKVAGLFAGIGGMELGLGRSGHHATVLCEIWDPAKAVLRRHFPEARLESDVTRLRSLPDDVELIAAGFPCQDLSQAGLTAGIEGARSSLVGQVFRLIDERRVPWVVLENVSFMLHLRRGQALEMIVRALEERGYRWAYRVVNSLAFLPQRRERVYLVATTTDVDPADVLLADDVQAPDMATSLERHAHGFYWTEGVRGLGWAPNAVPTLKNGSTVGIASPPAILLPSGEIVTPHIGDAERLQGFATGWTAAAEAVGRPSLRWSLVGNAVSVPVAEWLGGRLMEPGDYDAAHDRPLDPAKSWPRAARFDGVRRVGVDVGAFPSWRNRPHLHDFLQHPGKPLSARATRGFLGRTQRSTLRFPAGFLDRVHAHWLRVEDFRSSPSERVSVYAAE